MAKSSFKTFGFWLIILLVLYGLGLFFSAFLNMKTEKQKQVCIISGLIFIFLFGSQLWRDAKLILIDTHKKMISFTNIFTQRQVSFAFDDFDGFIDTYQSSRGGVYRVIYLVKDKKYVKKISSFYYSNLDELQAALTPLQYLGKKDFDIFKSFKILFGVQVLD